MGVCARLSNYDGKKVVLLLTCFFLSYRRPNVAMLQANMALTMAEIRPGVRHTALSNVIMCSPHSLSFSLLLPPYLRLSTAPAAPWGACGANRLLLSTTMKNLPDSLSLYCRRGEIDSSPHVGDLRRTREAEHGLRASSAHAGAVQPPQPCTATAG